MNLPYFYFLLLKFHYILSNLFWLLFCCIKLDYDNEFEIENKTKFLKYGNDRIRVIEIMEEKIEKGFY